MTFVSQEGWSDFYSDNHKEQIKTSNNKSELNEMAILLFYGEIPCLHASSFISNFH